MLHPTDASDDYNSGTPFPPVDSVLKAVVLAIRPPITLPRTTVSAGLLEELLGEIPLLASVYHKPAETFVGRGPIGADSVQRKGVEYVIDHTTPSRR